MYIFVCVCVCVCVCTYLFPLVILYNVSQKKNMLPISNTISQFFIYPHTHYQRLLKITNLSLSYKRYVVHTFMIFSSRPESRSLLFNTINQLNPALIFSCELVHNNNLPFLNVFVVRDKI